MPLVALTFDFWNVLLFLAAGQGIFLTFLLFPGKKEPNHQSQRWLSLLVLIFSLSLLDYLGYWTRLHVRFPHLASSYVWLTFLVGPFIYFYFKAEKHTSSKFSKIWVHLLPAALVLVLQSSFFILQTGDKISVILGNSPYPNLLGMNQKLWNTFVNFSTIFHLSFYSWLSLRVMRPLIKTNTFQRKFYLWLWALFLAYTLAYIFYVVMVSVPFYDRVLDYCIAIVMVISVYLLGYLAYKKPIILEQEQMSAAFQKPKYQNSALTNRAAQSLKNRLLEIMDQQKPYLESELRLPGLATLLDIPHHHLSQLINQEMGKSFTQFVNQYRIADAKKLLLETNQNVIEIAYQVGFNNKTSFYKAFKADTGKSPSQFRVNSTAIP